MAGLPPALMRPRTLRRCLSIAIFCVCSLMLFFAYSEVREHFTFTSVQLELDSEKERRLDGVCVCACVRACVCVCTLVLTYFAVWVWSTPTSCNSAYVKSHSVCTEIAFSVSSMPYTHVQVRRQGMWDLLPSRKCWEIQVLMWKSLVHTWMTTFGCSMVQ